MLLAASHLDAQAFDLGNREMAYSRMISKYRRYDEAIDKFTKSPETDLDLIKSCFWELRNAYAVASKRIARWFVFAIVLACVFELINLRLISSATLSFIEITRLNFLMYILPPAVAFTLIQAVAVGIEQGLYEDLMLKLAERKLPGLHASNIDKLFLAQAGLLGADIPLSLRGRSERLLYIYNMLQSFLLLIAYLGFETYAYSILLSRSYSVTITIISLSVTVLQSAALILFLKMMLSDV